MTADTRVVLGFARSVTVACCCVYREDFMFALYAPFMNNEPETGIYALKVHVHI